MNEEVEMAIEDANAGMQESLVHLEKQLSKIRAGRANPSMLDGVMVDYYDTPTPLGQVANVNTIDARTITVQPWEKSILDEVSRGYYQRKFRFKPPK